MMVANPARCPICRKPTQAEFRPFCSRRCRDVDLARWFGGGYAVPAEAQDSDGGSEASNPPPDDPGDGRDH